MESTNLPGTQIRILNPAVARGAIRHVLFDFDGTLSLIREGWQDVMVPMMVEVLAELATGESTESLERTVREYVTRLTGKQTIYQMIELAEQVRRRGGTPREPLDYKHEYLGRLERRIRARLDGLANGSLRPDDLLLPGSRELLDALSRRGVRMYLASGTDEPFVLREARLLAIDRYFQGRTFGALDDYRRFSKKLVIERILAEHDLKGLELLGIGDGYVEIENTKAVGGIALAVASCEHHPVSFDTWKADRLQQAGADLMVPNFLEHAPLLQFLFDAE